MSAETVQGLQPPRRAVRPASAPPAEAAELLDPSTVLVPTRFLGGAQPSAEAAGGALCDGRRTLAELAREGGLDLDLARTLLSRLYAQGLVCETGSALVPSSLFLEHAQGLCWRWRRARLGHGPALEACFASGSYSRRLATGYLLEVTHVVRGAAGHIAAAIAHASDEGLQLRLSEYLEDEYWHGELMERALKGAGLGQQELARAVPLPATQAVLNSWRHAAHTDLLLYGGLIAITESATDESSAIVELFHRTLAQRVLPEAAWRPYFEHAFGDSAADHVSHGRAIFEAAGPLLPSRRDQLRRALLLHSEALVLQERAVLSFYAEAEGPAAHALEWSE